MTSVILLRYCICICLLSIVIAQHRHRHNNADTYHHNHHNNQNRQQNSRSFSSQSSSRSKSNSRSLQGSSNSYEDVGRSIISIPDGGRRFELGQLYDAGKEQAIDAKLWSKDMIDAHTYTDDAAFTSTTITTEDTLQARADLLGINIEVSLVQVAFPTAELEFSGSFNYLNEKRTSSQSIKVAQAYKSRTKRKVLDSFHNDLISPININAKAFDIATHFVSSITYGANVVASYEATYESEAEESTIQLAINGKLDMPDAGISTEASGAFNSNSSAADMLNKMQVSIHGDLRITEPIPNTFEDAVAFMASMPEKTGTIYGDEGLGVPMDIILSPLSWINTNAGKLLRKITGDTLTRLIQIYDSFDQSDVLIRDVRAMPYGGFIAWKEGIDSFYIRFRNYRADFSLVLGDAIIMFKAGSIDSRFLSKLELTYMRSSNKYNLKNIKVRMEKEKDIIASLMALGSDFPSSGITFASNLREYAAPTFNTRYDRVYALILVGMNPSADRASMEQIRKFQKLSLANYAPLIDIDVNHCKFTMDKTGAQSCVEKQKFVVIHFDSFCFDFCPASFCTVEEGFEDLPLCPTQIGANLHPPFCDVDRDTAKYLDCSPNTEAGRCKPELLISDPHHYDNLDNPFSDCWCSCPQTQIIEFVNNAAPVRLVERMHKVPPKPKILSINVLPIEPDPLNQMIAVEIEEDPSHVNTKALNYAITVDKMEVNRTSEGTDYIITSFQVVTQNDKTRFDVGNLVAGTTYKFKVSGVNSVGTGPYAISDAFQIGERMVIDEGFCALPRKTDGTCHQPSLHSARSIPSWLDSHVTFGMTTSPDSRLRRISLHSSLDESIEKFNKAVDTTFLAECNFLTAGAFISYTPGQEQAACTFELKDEFSNPASQLRLAMQDHKTRTGSLSQYDMPVYVRMWDEFDDFIGSGTWTLLLPSEQYCRDYGLGNNFYCSSEDNERCVSKCSHCNPSYVPLGNICSDQLCGSNKLFCPVPYEYRPQNYKDEVEEDASENCFPRNNVDSDTVCKKYCHRDSTAVIDAPRGPLCLSPCLMSLPGNLETDFFVQRSETREIGCAADYVVDSGEKFSFTCTLDLKGSDRGKFDDGTEFVYDSQRLRQLGEETPSITNFHSSTLSCSRCGPGQEYISDLDSCRFLPYDTKEFNFVNDGSFVGVISSNYEVNGTVTVNQDESLDGEGGSVAMSIQSSLSQTIKVFNEVSFGANLMAPPFSTWGASIYFKVPERFKGRDKANVVGSFFLGGPDNEWTEVELLVLPRVVDDWFQTHIRHTFGEEKSKIIVNVTSTFQDLKIDCLEVTPLEDVLTAKVSANDITRGIRSQFSVIDEAAAISNTGISNMTDQYDSLLAQHAIFLRQMEQADNNFDSTITSLVNWDRYLENYMKGNDLKLYHLHRRVLSFRYTQMRYCRGWWFRRSILCRYMV